MGLATHLTTAWCAGRVSLGAILATLVSALVGHAVGGVAMAFLVHCSGISTALGYSALLQRNIMIRLQLPVAVILARAFCASLLVAGAAMASCTLSSRAGKVALTVLSGATFRFLSFESLTGSVFMMPLAHLLGSPVGGADSVLYLALIAAGNIAAAVTLSLLVSIGRDDSSLAQTAAVTAKSKAD